MKNTVTVAIPVYNGQLFIEEAINSVVEQSIKVNRILICDNCSDDQTVEIVRQCIKKYPGFEIDIHVNKENIGFQNNFIKCYELASTDYLVILHVDDLLKPNAIEMQLEFFQKNQNYAVLGGQVDSIDKDGNVFNTNDKEGIQSFQTGEIYEFIRATSSYMPFSTVMYNLNLTRDIDFMAEESVGPDELFWPLLLKVHPIAILNQSLILNRVYDGQMHVNNSIEMFDKYIKHFQDKLSRADLESTEKRKILTRNVIKQQIARMSIKIGFEIFQYGSNNRIVAKYYWYGISQYRRIVFTKFFVKIILRSLNLYKI